MVLIFPVPTRLQELLATDRLATRSLVAQLALDLKLSGYAGVVGARHPQRRPTPHALIANHQVLQSHEERVPLVKDTGHVRRRDRDHERLRVRAGGFRFEPAVRLPPVVQPLFGSRKVVRFGHIKR